MKLFFHYIPFFIITFLLCNCDSSNKNQQHTISKQIDNYSFKIDSLVNTNLPRKFNGVILITKNGQTIYSKSSGYSSFDQNIPIKLEDNFRIQSNSKQVTAVLILKQVENGKIDLNSPINKYLPNFKQKWGKDVTVHQLLNMSSGVVHLDKPLKYEPGTDFNYSNPAYSLLGRILENTSNKSFEELANATFLNLGMNNSYCYKFKGNNERLINGYNNSLEEYSVVDFYNLGFTIESWKDFIPAGGIISNVKDLNIWDTKLHNGKILKPEAYKTMIESEVIDFHDAFSEKKINYGYGVNISKDNPIKYIGHAGSGLGFASLKFYIPEKNVNVIILENVYNNDISLVYHFEKGIRNIVLNSNLIE